MIKLQKYTSKYFTFFLLLIGIIILPLEVVCAEHLIEVYIYTLPESYRFREIKTYFDEKLKLKSTVYYLNDSHYLDEFLEIIYLLAENNVPLLPPNICIPCEIKGGNSWRDIYIAYGSPLVLVFRDGRLEIIIISVYDRKLLDQIINQLKDAGSLKVFSSLSAGLPLQLSENVRVQIENLFRKKMKSYANILQVLSLTIAAAFVDAINPCEFFILIVFLSLITMRLGRKAVLKFGVAFSAAIFAAYFLMGLGIWRLMGYVREVKIFVVILGLSLGLRSILNFIFGFLGLSVGLREAIGGFLNIRFKRVPKIFSEKVAEILRRFSSNPLSAFLIGIVTSAFLLPCTSGPYLIALSLIADVETQIHGLILLIVYNSIFITPFLAITLGMYMLKIRISELKKWSSNKQRWLNLAGGLLMIALSIYLISYAL